MPRQKSVCYMVISARGLVWLLLNIVGAVAIMISLYTPHWIISSHPETIETNNITVFRNPSFGLNSRCKKMSSGSFSCNTFPISLPNELFPMFWKSAWILMSLSFALLVITCLMICISFCRQSCCGKSLPGVIGSLQILSAIFALTSIFSYPVEFGSRRVQNICIDSSPFYLGDCNFGYSFCCGIIGVVFAFIVGLFSIKVDKVMNPQIKRRIEEGDERLVFSK